MLSHRANLSPAPPGTVPPPDRLPQDPFLSLPWHSLPLEGLHPYDRVHRQYASLGLVMAGAMAIRPSNPQFIQPSDRRALVLMPVGQHRGFALELTQPLHQVQVWVRGTGSIALVGLSRDGYCIAHGCTATPVAHHDTAQPLPRTVLTLQTHGVQTLHLESPVPFVVDAIRVQRSPQALANRSVIPLPSPRPA
jgi:hypothetical protein